VVRPGAPLDPERTTQPDSPGCGVSAPPRTKPTAWSPARLVAAKVPQAATRTGPRRMPFVLLIAGLLVGGLCALLALNTAAAAAELRRQSLTQANADSADDVQQLEAELAARQAPAALGSAAAALGMVPADHPAFLRIQPDGRVKVMGSSQPQTPAPVPTATATPTARPTTPAATRPSTRSATQPSTTPVTKPSTTPTPTGGHR